MNKENVKKKKKKKKKVCERCMAYSVEEDWRGEGNSRYSISVPPRWADGEVYPVSRFRMSHPDYKVKSQV